MSKVKTSVYVDREKKAQLRRVAELRGESVNATLNLILSACLPEMETAAVRVRQMLSKKGCGLSTRG